MQLFARLAPLLIVSWVAIAGCVSSPPRAQTLEETPAARQALNAVVSAEARFQTEAGAEGIVPAFRRYVGPEAIMFLPDPVIINPRLERANWPGELSWRPAYAIVSAAGDVVVTAGPSIWANAGSADYGYYFTVWTRQPAGDFRFVVDGSATMASDQHTGFDGPPEAVFATPNAQTEGDVVQLESAFSGEAERDAGAAIASRMAPRARLLRAGYAPAVGPDAAMSLLAQGPRQARYRHEGGGVSRSQDVAWSYGGLTWDEAGAARRGVYVRIWLRDEGGQWRIGLDQMAEVANS